MKNIPRRNPMTFRLTDAEKEKLDYCCKVFALDKLEVIRWGIDDLYDVAQKIKSFHAEYLIEDSDEERGE